jgi:hypothetical protein
MESIRGQRLGGNVLGASWSFTVTGGKHGAASVAFAPKARGPAVTAAVQTVSVEGSLTILGSTHPVTISADRATVTGDTELSVDPAKGALRAAMTNANVALAGFEFDANNAGFACCVDTILTTFLRPKIEEALREGVRKLLASALELTLDRVGIPRAIDLSKAGISQPIAVEPRFDGALFDEGGGTLTASVLFGGAFAPEAPGAKAPGWLSVGKPVLRPRRAASLGASFSLDAVNQLLFAAWGQGGLSFAVPAPIGATLTPKLPPIVSITDTGALRVGLGEVVAQRPGEQPMAAVTVLQDLVAQADERGLVLAPQGEATMSITWLNETAATGGPIIAAAAKDQLGQLLKPVRIPLPTVPLDKLGPAFAGQAIAIQSPKVAVDVTSGRLAASGTLTLAR